MEDLLVILVVEDEELIRNVVEETLDDGGFKVILAESGEEAVRLLDVSDPKYRALVTDIKLGHGKLTGWDVARHARSIDPELAVVYMTGNGAAEWASEGVPNSVLLTRPLAPRSWCQRWRNLSTLAVKTLLNTLLVRFTLLCSRAFHDL